MNDNMNSAALVPLAETMELGTVLAKSGFFADSTQAAQAVVKVLAGREIGVGPIAAMTGIHIIKGKPAIGANLMAATIKNSRRYNYRIRQHDETVCAIEFFERTGDKWESVGTSTFTIADARKAGTQNIDKFARNMLFARAMSNGARWFCPDIFGGAPIYTPEEMGASVDEDGDVIDVQARVVQAETQARPEPAPAKTNGTHHEPQPPTDDEADALFEQMQSAQAERQPENTTTTEPGKPAVVRTTWFVERAPAFVQEVPYYANSDGKPDLMHMRMSAAKAGYPEITGPNLPAVFEALRQRAQNKQQQPA